MKIKSKISLLCVYIGLLLSCADDPKSRQSGQEKPIDEKVTVKKDTAKQMNLLDKQTELLGTVFGMTGNSAENPIQGATNYLQLLEKIDMPEAQKQELRDMYKLYDLGLDPRKKDSVKILFNKKFKEAMTNSGSNPG